MTRTKEDYDRNLRAGLCPQCGRERDAERFEDNGENGYRTKFILCSRCLQGNRRRSLKVTKKAKALYMRRYRLKMKRAGLCPHCGQEPEPGLVHCRQYLDAAWRYRTRKRLGINDN